MTAQWPEHPYKGLSYYGPDDVLLFAGRKQDVERIAPILGHPSVRILIMHGRTGCGKTSFLRAGLIPYLERPEHSYQFLKEEEVGSRGTSAIFIRSGDNPLIRLAENLFEWGGRRLEIETPVGKKTIGLDEIRLGHTTLDAFVEDAGLSGDHMVESLSIFARFAPRTLVIVIDQAEEVLTLQPKLHKDDGQSNFFDFLAAFATSRMDLKLVISLRSEFYAEFDSEIRKRQWNTENIQQEQLLVLDEQAIVCAIKYPIRHSDYGFTYETGLPARISNDLAKALPSGGALPVMQIICEQLYKNAKRRNPDSKATITTSDYEALGGVELQVDSYLHGVLNDMCTQYLSGQQAEDEINKWYEILSLMVRHQIDGTSTKDLRTINELTEQCQKLRCAVEFDKAMKFLNGRRIVQKARVHNIQTDEVYSCFTLGHDALGLALRGWEERGEGRDQAVNRAMYRFRYMGFGMLIYAIIFAALDIWLDWRWLKWAWGGTAAYAGLFLLFARFPHFLRSSSIFTRLLGDFSGADRLGRRKSRLR